MFWIRFEDKNKQQNTRIACKELDIWLEKSHWLKSKSEEAYWKWKLGEKNEYE